MKELDNRFEHLNRSLSHLLEYLKEYSDERLNRKPADDAWSVLQVMQHMMLSERLSHLYIKKKLSFDPKLKWNPVQNGLRMTLLKFYLGTPFKWKAPEMVGSEQLPDQSSFWEVAKKWKQQRNELHQFLHEVPPQHFNKLVYRHPVVGRISLYGMLGFFDAHFKRHERQIYRILK